MHLTVIKAQCLQEEESSSIAVTELYPLMDNVSIKLCIFFSVIESLMVIKLIWAKKTEKTSPILWQCWHFEFTATTTRPNADEALKLNHLRQPAPLPARGFASHLNTDRTSHSNRACHIDLPPRRVKFTKEEQKKRVNERECETHKSIRWHCQTKRALTDVCAVVQWSMEEVYVGNKEDLQHSKPLREQFSICICSF